MMPRLLSADDVNARFCVEVFRDDDDLQGSDNYYATLNEARFEADRLQKTGNFKFGHVTRWTHSDQWLTVESWPGGWDPDAEDP